MSAASTDGPFEATDRTYPPYRNTGRSVHALVYYILLVTRRRRPHFADEAAAARVEELLREEAERMELGVDCIDVNPATVTIHVQAPPTLAPHMIVRNLRRAAAGPLKDEFAHIQAVHSVFVRDYMVTTMPVPDTDCDAFERRIPKRWEPTSKDD